MSTMSPEKVAELVARTLADAERRTSHPIFAKVAWADDAIAVEGIDGSFFILTVAEADHIAF